MRVTFLTHYAGLYGANRSLLDLIDGLKEFGVLASVIAPRGGDLSEELRKRGVPFWCCELGRGVMAASRTRDGKRGGRELIQSVRAALGVARKNARSLGPIVKILRSWRTDVVYSNSSILLSGALAASYLRLPHIWHLREFGELDYNLRPVFGRSFQQWLVSRADSTIAVSDNILKHYNLEESARAHVIFNGVAAASEFERLRDVASARPAKPDIFTFALVGLLHPTKGQETAIKALHIVARTHPHVRLLFAGSGRDKYLGRLERMVDDLRLREHVNFLGFVDDPHSVYLDSDAVLMCSRSEAMGRVTVEAMAACKPVVGFDGGGTQEIIEHMRTGLLYRGGSEALASCMILLTENPIWARELGMSGWKKARDSFTIEAYAARIHDILLNVTRPPAVANESATAAGSDPEDRIRSAPEYT